MSTTSLGAPARVAGPLMAASIAGAVVAFLVSTGRWYLAVACLLAVPAFAVFDRHPLAVVTVWLIVAPLVTETDDNSTRKVFWVVHRFLPVATVVLLMVASATGQAARRLPRLGPAELMMGGYVAITVVSIAYSAAEPQASLYHLYDATVVPMSLYLLVRLVQPDVHTLRPVLPAVACVLLAQSLIGIASWVAPGMLPTEWLGKIGQRTPGSLRTPDVFATTVLFCGLFLLAAGLTARGFVRRMGPILLFALSIVMVFLTYSRASWLAGIVAIAGVLVLARGSLQHILVVIIPIALLLNLSGLLSGPIDFARNRLESEEAEESALSRLPVVYASLRMLDARPTFGWGYENFDRFDREFQRPVGNLVYPEKDHASHNLYLTILAEQGVVGLALFLGPAVWWLARTRARWRYLPTHTLDGRMLVGALWLVIAGHVIVNNFARMQVPFGFGIYWLSLGLIAALVSTRAPATDDELARL
jgi:O-antigen ligase